MHSVTRCAWKFSHSLLCVSFFSFEMLQSVFLNYLFTYAATTCRDVNGVLICCLSVAALSGDSSDDDGDEPLVKKKVPPTVRIAVLFSDVCCSVLCSAFASDGQFKSRFGHFLEVIQQFNDLILQTDDWGSS